MLKKTAWGISIVWVVICFALFIETILHGKYYRYEDMAYIGAYFGGAFGPVIIIWLLMNQHQQAKDFDQTTRQLTESIEALTKSADAHQQLAQFGLRTELEKDGPYIFVDGSPEIDSRRIESKYILKNTGVTISGVIFECTSHENIDLVITQNDEWVKDTRKRLILAARVGSPVPTKFTIKISYFKERTREERNLQFNGQLEMVMMQPTIIGG